MADCSNTSIINILHKSSFKWTTPVSARLAKDTRQFFADLPHKLIPAEYRIGDQIAEGT